MRHLILTDIDFVLGMSVKLCEFYWVMFTGDAVSVVYGFVLFLAWLLDSAFV